MKVEINIDNRKSSFLLLLVLLVFAASLAVAYNSSLQPSVMGHSIDEIEGAQARVSGICAVGNSVRQINADGTVVCESDDKVICGWGSFRPNSLGSSLQNLKNAGATGICYFQSNNGKYHVGLIDTMRSYGTESGTYTGCKADGLMPTYNSLIVEYYYYCRAG